MDSSTLINKEIVVFNWMNFLDVAFDLYLHEGPRLRIRKDAFWRVLKEDEVLFSSLTRKSDKALAAMRDTFEGKTIKAVSTRPNGDIVFQLNDETRLELLCGKAQSCLVEYNDSFLDFGPYKWRVLAYDGSKMLLVTKDLVAAQSFDGTNQPVNWESCQLRKWMRQELLTKFSEEERARILTTHLPDTGTDDEMFLLSENEAKTLFTSDADRVCFPDEEAKQNLWTDSKGAGFWWLRDSEVCEGSSSIEKKAKYVSALYVDAEGSPSVKKHGMAAAYYVYGVRPAMWVSLKE